MKKKKKSWKEDNEDKVRCYKTTKIGVIVESQ